MSNETDAEKRARLFAESRRRTEESRGRPDAQPVMARDYIERRETERLAAEESAASLATFRDGLAARHAARHNQAPPPAEERPRFVPPPPKAPPKMPSRKGELKQLLKLSASLGLKSPERLVLAALYSFTDGYGFCFPGVETLLDMTGLSDRRIRTALDTLREVGVVPALKAERSGQYTFSKGGKSLRRGQSLFLVWPIATDTGKQHFIGMLKNAHPDIIDSPEIRAAGAKQALLPLSVINQTAAAHAKRRAEQSAPVPLQSATG